LQFGVPPGGQGGKIYGVLTEPVVNGQAVFDKLYVQQVALNGLKTTPFNLTAISPNRPDLKTDTTSFDVGTGAPVSFKITAGAHQPNIDAGNDLQPVTVQLVDADNNIVATNTPINVSFGIKPNGSTDPFAANPIQQINIYVNGSDTPQLYDTLPMSNGMV